MNGQNTFKFDSEQEINAQRGIPEELSEGAECLERVLNWKQGDLRPCSRLTTDSLCDLGKLFHLCMASVSKCEMNCLIQSVVFKVCSEGTVGPRWGSGEARSCSGSGRAATFLIHFTLWSFMRCE